jgi:hypothetical protein
MINGADRLRRGQPRKHRAASRVINSRGYQVSVLIAGHCCIAKYGRGRCRLWVNFPRAGKELPTANVIPFSDVGRGPTRAVAACQLETWTVSAAAKPDARKADIFGSTRAWCVRAAWRRMVELRCRWANFAEHPKGWISSCHPSYRQTMAINRWKS